MSNIAAGTTSTTALVATADTTGALVFQTGASATTAMTISSTQTVSFTNLLNYYTASLGADVSLTNTATYFDGPSVAQGTSGTWLVTAHVTVAGNADNIFAKLWDGTTVVSSTETDGPASGSRVTITLNGIFVNPAGIYFCYVVEESLFMNITDYHNNFPHCVHSSPNSAHKNLLDSCSQ